MYREAGIYENVLAKQSTFIMQYETEEAIQRRTTLYEAPTSKVSHESRDYRSNRGALADNGYGIARTQGRIG